MKKSIAFLKKGLLILKDIIIKYIKNNILFILFVLSTVINSTLLRMLTVKNYFDIKPIVADLAIALIVGAFGYYIKPKKQFRYYLGFSIFFTFICFANSLYYSNYVSFASISLLSTAFTNTQVGDVVFTSIFEWKDLLYLWVPIFLIVINHWFKKSDYYNTKLSSLNLKAMATNTLIVGIVVLGLFISSLSSLELSRFNKQWNREYVVMRFGIYSYQINDVFVSLEPQINSLFGFQEKVKEFNDFYASYNTEMKQNQYTNIFKGKNMLVIHAESIQNFTLGLEFNGIPVTPNLNKLTSEGIYFSNFYAEDSIGTSSDTEFTFNTSLLPSSSGTVFVNYWDREYVTIPKLLKPMGYYSFSMHGNNGTFWNRNVMHKQMGYDNFFYYTKDYNIDEVVGLGLSDKSFFRQSVPKIKKISEEHKNFYATIIMLSNHTPFTDVTTKGLTDFSVDYKYNKVNETTGLEEPVSAPYLEGTKLGDYIKSVNYADSSIGQFINDLDAEGLLDNTVVVIYGDHDAKIKRSEFARFYNYDPYTDSVKSPEDPTYYNVDDINYEINRKVPFIIWTKDKQFNTKVTKVMGMDDTLPTLGNMFGFSSPYQLGHDIFSTDENVVVFPSGNWVTDKLYYDGQREEWRMFNLTDTVGLDYIQKYKEYAEKVLSVSNSIIVYDLIKNKENIEANQVTTK